MYKNARQKCIKTHEKSPNRLIRNSVRVTAIINDQLN